MAIWSEKFAALVITLWVGALWAIGYLAAPSLFYSLPGDTATAGMLAGRMFALLAYLGMASAAYLLLQRLMRAGMDALREVVFWVVVLMLLLTLAGHFGVQPILAQLKAQAMSGDVMHSVFRDRFAAWHGVASIAHLIQSLLGIVLVVKSR